MKLTTLVNIALTIILLIAPIAFYVGYERQIELENHREGQ